MNILIKDAVIAAGIGLLAGVIASLIAWHFWLGSWYHNGVVSQDRPPAPVVNTMGTYPHYRMAV